MKRTRPASRRELPDIPGPDLSQFRGLDDATVARAASAGDPLAKLEVQERLRLEACWSGNWASGPPAPVPAPPPGYERFRGSAASSASTSRHSNTHSSELQRRRRFRKLMQEATEGPKAARDVAKYLLERDFGKSFP